MSWEAVAQVTFGCSEVTESTDGWALLCREPSPPSGAWSSLMCPSAALFASWNLSFSLCHKLSSLHKASATFLAAVGFFSSERSPQLPAATAGCRSALLRKLFPIHQSEVFPYSLPAGCPPPATFCKLKPDDFPVLTVPQLTVKGSGCPRPPPPQPPQAGLEEPARGWERGVCCASTSRKRGLEQISRLPPHSASQAAWVCARLSLTAGWVPCPGLSHERHGLVPGCPGFSDRRSGVVPGFPGLCDRQPGVVPGCPGLSQGARVYVTSGPALSQDSRVSLRKAFPAPVGPGWVRTPAGNWPGSFWNRRRLSLARFPWLPLAWRTSIVIIF